MLLLNETYKFPFPLYFCALSLKLSCRLLCLPCCLKTHCPKLHLLHSTTLKLILVPVLSGLRGELQEANGALCFTVAGIWVSKPVARMPAVLIFWVFFCVRGQGFSPHGAEVEGDDGASEEGEGMEL